MLPYMKEYRIFVQIDHRRKDLSAAPLPGIERMGIDKYYMGNEALHGIIRPENLLFSRRRSDLPVCGILSYIILLPVLFQMKPVPAGMNWNGKETKRPVQ